MTAGPEVALLWRGGSPDGVRPSSAALREVSPWSWHTAGYLAAAFVAGLDSNLLAPNLTAAARSFGFSDAERDAKLGGQLSLGFFLFAAPVALLAGNLADLFPRRPLLAAAIALGMVPCLLTFFVKEYWQFFALRIFMAFTVGAIPPLTSSLAGDIFPVESRTLGTAVFGTCLGLGALFGQFLAGCLGPRYGWRLPFLLAGLLGLVVAAAVLCLREPERGAQEAALQRSAAGGESGEALLPVAPVAYEERLTPEKVGAIFAVPSNVLGLVQGLPGCMPWGVINAYLNDYLAQDRGLSIQEATQVMVSFRLANVVGNLLGGVLGQAIYNKWRPGLPLLMGGSTTLGILPTLALINHTFGRDGLPLMHIIAFVGGVVVTVTSGNIRTVFLNVNRPEVRGTVFGLTCIMDDVGKGFGPFVAATLISRLGRLAAFNACVWMWLVCGVLLSCIAFTLEQDEQVQQEQLALYAEESSAHTPSEGCEPHHAKAR